MTGTRDSSRTTSPKSATRGNGAKRAGVLATATVFGVTTLTAFAPRAHADEVSPTGKGIVGGALLGGEVVTITEALIGVKNGWAYVIGGVLGAGAGGVGGYFIEHGTTDAKVPVFMLAGGISLLIPALVLSLNATRYQESAEATEDRAPTGPAPEPGAIGGSMVIGGSGSASTPSAPPATTPAPTTTPPPATTPSATPPKPPGSGGPPSTGGHGPSGGAGALLDLGGGAMRVGVPVPQVRAMYSQQQLKELGVPQQTEYRLPVVHVTF